LPLFYRGFFASMFIKEIGLFGEHLPGLVYTVAAVECLLLSKHTGVGGTTLTFSVWLIYLQFAWGVPLPLLWWSFPHNSHCYKLTPLKGC
jgi:hypothetical protein